MYSLHASLLTDSNLQGGRMEAYLKLMEEEQSKPNRNVAVLPFLSMGILRIYPLSCFQTCTHILDFFKAI